MLGFSYDPESGAFTIPPGGDGLYYFSTYLLSDDGEIGYFDLTVNDGGLICTAVGDHSDNPGDFSQAACSGLAQLVEGEG